MRNYLLPVLLVLLIASCNSNKKTAPQSSQKTTQPSDSTRIELRGIRPGVWVHTSYNTFEGKIYPANGLVVQVQDSLYLINTAWGVEKTRVLLQEIERKIGLPITRAVATHFHADAVAGADLLESKGIEVYAHPKTPPLAKAEGNAVPDYTFTGLSEPGNAVSFGPLEIFYPGPAHSVDNIMVWVPEQKILFGGCPVRSAKTTTLGNTAVADLNSWPKAIKRAQQAYPELEVVVPGHGEVGGPELLDHTLALFKK